MQTFTNLTNTDRPLIIAHRGDSDRARENTLEAFELAIEAGADAIEFDVRRTADGVLVVHHNKNVKGMRQPLSRLTYEEVIAASGRKGYRIPTLRETVEFCAGRITLDVELKEAGYESEVLDIVLREYDAANVLFTSFIDNSLKALKRADARIVTGLLVGFHGSSPDSRSVLERFRPRERLKKCGADVLLPQRRWLVPGYLKRLQDRDIPVIVWTVNQPRIAKSLIAKGVAGIITNKPDVMVGV